MSSPRVWASRVSSFFSKEKLDRQLDEELQCHLDMIVEEKIRSGLSPEEAKWAARKEFGGLDQVKEVYRDRRGLPFVESVVQDFGHALRMMRRQPVLTAVVGLTLALGIGANTSLFSLFNTLFLHPLPYPQPARLLVAGEYPIQQGQPAFVGLVRYSSFEQWRAQNRVFDGVSAWRRDEVTLNAAGDPERVRGYRVSADFFQTFGMQPLQGRVLAADDFAPGASRTAVIGERYWRSKFNGEDVIGKTVRVEGYPTTIVGVMPARFQASMMEGGPRLWLPLRTSDEATLSSERIYSVAARLKPAASLDEARSAMSAIARALEETQPASNKGRGVRLEPMQENYAQGASTPVARLLVIAAGILLLISCVNVANLLLVKGVERTKEISLRVALGASRLRIVRQLMIENFVYATMGCVGGLLLAHWTMSALSRFGATIFSDSGIDRFAIDERVLRFSLLISAGASLVFGALPAMRSSRVDLHETLKEGGGGSSLSLPKRRLNSALVVSELALSLMLLISAGFVLRSIQQFWHFDWGFPIENRLAMSVSLSGKNYADQQTRARFYADLLAKLQQIPGLHSAAAASSLPIQLAAENMRVDVGNNGTALMAAYRAVSPDYMRALEIPLKKGRFFTDRDTASGQPVAVVNESMARKAWNGTDPIGQVIKVKGVERTVVGIVGDVVNQGLLRRTGNEVSVPYSQEAPATMALILHVTGDPAPYVIAAKEALAALDPDQPLSDIKTLKSTHADLRKPLEFVFGLLGLFAVTALIMATVGLYGLTAHSVSLRTREIGIRMAMGACSRGVVADIVRRGLVLIVVGILLGSAFAFVSVRVLLTQVWWLSPSGPHVIAGVAFLLGLVAMIACYIPARRATRVDPAVALRAE